MAGETQGAGNVRTAEVVLPCTELQPTVDFFVQRLGFRLERISPADDPRSASLSGHGLRLLLRRGADGPPGTLRLLCDDPAAFGAGELVAPDGTRIEIATAEAAPHVPPATGGPAVARAAEAAWVTGRAGMLYRDLIPGRMGGRFGAAHIRIPTGGPVADDVHYHAVRFQMIHCARGWVRLVYEDQGPPFVLAAGDTVLQPPRIRHRVLECSPGLEVIELASPGEHDTFLDHELALPTAHERPERTFDGQRFVHHRPVGWAPADVPGLQCNDPGIGPATEGLAGVRVLRPADGASPAPFPMPVGELWFGYLLSGRLTLTVLETGPLELRTGDAVALHAENGWTLAEWTRDLRLLEVRLPA